MTDVSLIVCQFISIVQGHYPGAWLAGFFSFVTLSGLGVREGILSYFLSTIIPTPQALAVALVARLWTIIAELTGVIFVWGKQWLIEHH